MRSAESERHARFASDFAAVTALTTDWDAQTPVPEWRARDVVEHLVDWLPGVLSRWGGVDLPSYEGEDLPVRWQRRSADVQAAFDDPEVADRTVADGPFAGQTVAQVLDRIYTTDVYMHTWDLAKAVGAPIRLDPGYAAAALSGMQAMGPMLRESGHFGPSHPTTSTDPVEQLMAFVGRDPEFGSPA